MWLVGADRGGAGSSAALEQSIEIDSSVANIISVFSSNDFFVNY